MMKRLWQQQRKGFTLIELMIVIAIIAILAAILVPNFLRARAQSQLSACEANEKSLATALEMYSTDNNGNYPTGALLTPGVLTLITPTYLRTLPTCPANGLNYAYIGQGVTVLSAYTVQQGGTPANVHAGLVVVGASTAVNPNRPFYTSSGGLFTR